MNQESIKALEKAIRPDIADPAAGGRYIDYHFYDRSAGGPEGIPAATFFLDIPQRRISAANYYRADSANVTALRACRDSCPPPALVRRVESAMRAAEYLLRDIPDSAPPERLNGGGRASVPVKTERLTCPLFRLKNMIRGGGEK